MKIIQRSALTHANLLKFLSHCPESMAQAVKVHSQFNTCKMDPFLRFETELLKCFLLLLVKFLKYDETLHHRSKKTKKERKGKKSHLKCLKSLCWHSKLCILIKNESNPKNNSDSWMEANVRWMGRKWAKPQEIINGKKKNFKESQWLRSLLPLFVFPPEAHPRVALLDEHTEMR